MHAMEESQVIEKTHKRYKLAKIFGVIFVIGSFDMPAPALGAAMFFFGVGLYLYAKFGAWWRNG